MVNCRTVATTLSGFVTDANMVISNELDQAQAVNELKARTITSQDVLESTKQCDNWSKTLTKVFTSPGTDQPRNAQVACMAIKLMAQVFVANGEDHGVVVSNLNSLFPQMPVDLATHDFMCSASITWFSAALGASAPNTPCPAGQGLRSGSCQACPQGQETAADGVSCIPVSACTLPPAQPIAEASSSAGYLFALPAFHITPIPHITLKSIEEALESTPNGIKPSSEDGIFKLSVTWPMLLVGTKPTTFKACYVDFQLSINIATYDATVSNATSSKCVTPKLLDLNEFSGNEAWTDHSNSYCQAPPCKSQVITYSYPCDGSTNINGFNISSVCSAIGSYPDGFKNFIGSAQDARQALIDVITHAATSSFFSAASNNPLEFAFTAYRLAFLDPLLSRFLRFAHDTSSGTVSMVSPFVFKTQNGETMLGIGANANSNIDAGGWIAISKICDSNPDPMGLKFKCAHITGEVSGQLVYGDMSIVNTTFYTLLGDSLGLSLFDIKL